MLWDNGHLIFLYYHLRDQSTSMWIRDPNMSSDVYQNLSLFRAKKPVAQYWWVFLKYSSKPWQKLAATYWLPLAAQICVCILRVHSKNIWKWPLACGLACRKKTCLVTEVYRNNRWPRNTQPVRLISLYRIPVSTDRSHMMINVINLKWYLWSDFLMHHELTESVLYSQQRSSQIHK